jgi:hypothetical protein
MSDPFFRHAANEVIRNTVARVREARREVVSRRCAGLDTTKQEKALEELVELLRSMLALRGKS